LARPQDGHYGILSSRLQQFFRNVSSYHGAMMTRLCAKIKLKVGFAQEPRLVGFARQGTASAGSETRV
jgi:hypothetical protein